MGTCIVYLHVFFDIVMTNFLATISLLYFSFCLQKHTIRGWKYVSFPSIHVCELVNLSFLRYLHFATLMSTKAFQCLQCGKRCGNAGALKSHMKTHKKPEPKSGSLLKFLKRTPAKKAKPPIELKPLKKTHQLRLRQKVNPAPTVVSNPAAPHPPRTILAIFGSAMLKSDSSQNVTARKKTNLFCEMATKQVFVIWRECLRKESIIWYDKAVAAR